MIQTQYHRRKLNGSVVSTRGFTLVEVLVVIVIMITLAFLSFVGIRRFQETAMRARGIQLIHGLQLANASYASEHAGRYVPHFQFDEESNGGTQLVNQQWVRNPEFWAYIAEPPEEGVPGHLVEDSTRGEVKEQYRETILDPIILKKKPLNWDTMYGHFTYVQENVPGGNYGKPGATQGHTMATVSSPARTMCFASGNDWLGRYNGRFKYFEKVGSDGQPVEGQIGDGRIAYRYGGKVVVSYYDGHTELLSKADIKEIDNKGGRSHPFWGGD